MEVMSAMTYGVASAANQRRQVPIVDILGETETVDVILSRLAYGLAIVSAAALTRTQGSK
jgi:hypothetical protein